MSKETDTLVRVGTHFSWSDVIDHAVCVSDLSEEKANRLQRGEVENWLEKHSDTIVDRMVAAGFDAIETLLYEDPLG